MNAARFEAFRRRIHGLEGPAIWSREITLNIYRATN
jgi:hypothetical protein